MVNIPNIQYEVQAAFDGKLPEYFNPKGLEAFLNNGVVSNGIVLRPDHLNPDSSNFNSDVSFLVLGQKVRNGNSSYAGTLVAKSKEFNGFNFDYYDNVAVAPEYWENDVMKDMLGFAREVGNQDFEVPPALSLTDNPIVDKVYGTISDVSTKIGDIYVHGFGFYDNDGKPLFDNAMWEFQLVAHYFADLSQTPINAPELPQ